jgi:protein-tyrosine phosphatase
VTTTQPPSPAPEAPDRTLRWDGCVNVRDVGGLPTRRGSVTQSRALVRADSVRTLTDSGWGSLLAYGVRTIIDLRTPEECDRDPTRHVPLEVVRVPIVGRPPDEIRAAREAGKLASSFEAATAVYLDLLERERQSFADATTAFANAEEGTVVVHCAAGKDRTGLLVAMLLAVAGVPAASIVEDYRVSAPNIAAAYQGWIAAGETDTERELRRALIASPPEAMAGVLVHLDVAHGGAAGYLRAAGVSAEALALVPTRLAAS